MKSSGAIWNHKCSFNIRYMKCQPCLAYFDLWMRDRVDNYEYIAVMVDYLLVFRSESYLIVDTPKRMIYCGLNGVGELEYYSGADISLYKSVKCWTLSVNK